MHFKIVRILILHSPLPVPCHWLCILKLHLSAYIPACKTGSWHAPPVISAKGSLCTESGRGKHRPHLPPAPLNARNKFHLIVSLRCLHLWKIVSRIIEWRVFVCLFVCFGLFLCHHFKCYPDHSLLVSIVSDKKSFVTLVTLKGFLLCVMIHFPLTFP